jgi:hypothetical protein
MVGLDGAAILPPVASGRKGDTELATSHFLARHSPPYATFSVIRRDDVNKEKDKS